MNKKNNTNNILFGVIIALLVVIAILSFFVGKNMGTTVVTNSATVSAELPKDFTITVIDDKRCTDCTSDQFITQLRQAPGLATIDIDTIDFGDDGVAEMLQEEKITTLPAIIFSHNTGLDAGLTQYLEVLPSGKFTLNIGSTFNPFAERSERGNLMISQDSVNEILEGLHIQGDATAPITWLEYSDVNCYYCKKMETDGTAKEVLSAFPSDVNKAAINYVSVGGPATQTAAEVLECIGKIAGSEQYNNSFSETLSSGNNSKSALLAFAKENNVDEDLLTQCIDNGDMKDSIASKIAFQNANFGPGGTPRNIILNTQTGEYVILGGAYPAESFKASIEALK